jgi:transcriptional accessory protein Tex/SPT6
MVDQNKLEKYLESVAVSVVSQLGIDINFIIDKPHLHGQLAFVPGLGHRKAA